MISVKELDFHYAEGDFRLTIPEFTVSDSEKVAIIGPSGSGKTTLLNLLSGIITPLKGSIVVGNDHVSKMSDTNRRDFRIANIGFVFQDFELIEYLNVMDNILHPYRITAALTFNGTTKARVRDLAAQMGTRILDLLFQSVEDHDATLIAVTHDHELLKRFDRVIDFKEFQGKES
jgi:putative ABC transport system ATP-binding protein